MALIGQYARVFKNSKTSVNTRRVNAETKRRKMALATQMWMHNAKPILVKSK